MIYGCNLKFLREIYIYIFFFVMDVLLGAILGCIIKMIIHFLNMRWNFLTFKIDYIYFFLNLIAIIL